MRYEKTENLLHLAFEMQGSSEGVSLRDIMDRFSVSRRTAERMRDAVLRVFPQAEEVHVGDGLKRWRISARRNNLNIPITADELAAISAASNLLRHEGRGEQARMLTGLEAKLKSLLPSVVQHRIEPDHELLVQSEGLALRPGPRQSINAGVMQELREAVKGCRQVTLTYRSRSSGRRSRQTVHPYGFLYGVRHYLLAWNTNPKSEGFRLFSLANIEAAEKLEECFTRDAAFSLANYAARSFGVFQEEPYQVVWKVTPEAAPDARAWVFHPSQTVDDQPDGSLIIRFQAGGLLEMCWHLFKWSGAIEALEPPELVQMMDEQISHFQNDCFKLRRGKP